MTRKQKDQQQTKTTMQKPYNRNGRTTKTGVCSTATLACLITIALAAVHPAIAQRFITFDDLGLSPLGDVAMQYAARGVVFQGFTDSGTQTILEVADASVFSDNNPPSLPYSLSNFYNHDKYERAYIMRILFPDSASNISLMFNGSGSYGANIVFNVYSASSVLLDTFTVASATDSAFHLVTVPDSNVGYIDLVSPRPGWGFYIDNLRFTQINPPSVLEVPMVLNISLRTTVQNPIPNPNPAGIVVATTTAVKLTTAGLLALTANAHGMTYPKGAVLAVILAGQGAGGTVAVMDRTRTYQVDDVSDLLQVAETSDALQAVSGRWKIDPITMLKVSGSWTSSESLAFTFDNGAGTSFGLSALGKISYSLGAPDKNLNQRLTQSLTLTAGGDGTAINHSGSSESAVWIGTLSGSGKRLINQTQ